LSWNLPCVTCFSLCRTACTYVVQHALADCGSHVLLIGEQVCVH
jgi:hypothetical protein